MTLFELLGAVAISGAIGAQYALSPTHSYWFWLAQLLGAIAGILAYIVSSRLFERLGEPTSPPPHWDHLPLVVLHVFFVATCTTLAL